MRKKHWITARKEQGLCLDCHNKTVRNKCLCEECSQRRKEQREKKRQVRITNKLCPLCETPVQVGILCTGCCEKNQKKKQNRKENDLCQRCGKQSVGQSYCEICKKLNGEREKKKRINNLKNGNCKCGRLLIKGKKWCERCKQRFKDRIEQKKITGVCTNCPAQSRYGFLCEICYFKTYSNRHFGNYKFWRDLQEIYETQKICPYTGYTLEPGKMSLDHIIPLSKDGKNEKSNLQWLYGPVNTMKLNLLEDEFLEIVRAIAKHKLSLQVPH